MNRAEPIIVEMETPASPASAWSALTEHEQMIRWFFEDIPSFTSQKGFTTSFPVSSAERTFTHQWEITDVTPAKSIVYSWQYAEYPGTGEVTFEVDEIDGGSLVRVTNLGLETFPEDIPEFARESCEEGWKYFMGRLQIYLESL